MAAHPGGAPPSVILFHDISPPAIGPFVTALTIALQVVLILTSIFLVLTVLMH